MSSLDKNARVKNEIELYRKLHQKTIWIFCHYRIQKVKIRLFYN